MKWREWIEVIGFCLSVILALLIAAFIAECGGP